MFPQSHPSCIWRVVYVVRVRRLQLRWHPPVPARGPTAEEQLLVYINKRCPVCPEPCLEGRGRTKGACALEMHNQSTFSG